MVAAIETINHNQTQLLLFNKCISAIILYFQRVNNPSFMINTNSIIDNVITRGLSACLDINITENKRIELSLPAKDGGMGLNLAKEVGPVAFLASFMETKLIRSSISPIDNSLEQQTITTVLDIINTITK